jgi:sugar phosphate permease
MCLQACDEKHVVTTNRNVSSNVTSEVTSDMVIKHINLHKRPTTITANLLTCSKSPHQLSDTLTAMPVRVRVFLVYFCAYFLSYFFRSANAVIAEDLITDLGLSAEQLGRMTSVFFVTFAAAQLPFGIALDRFGARRVTPTLMLAAVIGSAIFATAPSFGMLLLGRALIGLGTAGILMGTFMSFSGWFNTRHLASVFSLLVGLGAFGGIGAATPLALLNDAFGWRNVFAGGAGVFLASSLAIYLWGKDAPRPAHHQDEPQGRFADIFASPIFWRIGLLNFTTTSALFAFQGLWAGPYLFDAIGLNGVQTGNILTALALGAITGFFACGNVARHVGIAVSYAGAGVGLSVVLTIISVFPSNAPLWLLAVVFYIYGIGGAFSLLSLSEVRRVFPVYMTGRAATANNLFGFGGSAVVQWGVGAFVSSFFVVNELGRYPGEAYRSAFAIMAALNTAALLFYLPRLYALVTARATPLQESS